MNVQPRVGALRRVGTFVPLHHEAGGIHETLGSDPQWQGALCVENTLAQRHALIGLLRALLALRANRTHRHPARANRLAQGTSCATRKPYPSPSGATHVIFEPLDFMYRTYGMPRAHDCRDAGGRAMPGAIAEEAQERPYPGWLLWCPGPELT